MNYKTKSLPNYQRMILTGIWISVIDLGYAYGQINLAPETSKHCNFAINQFGRTINGYYRFLKGFYGPADIPTIFKKERRPNTLPPNSSMAR